MHGLLYMYHCVGVSGCGCESVTVVSVCGCESVTVVSVCAWFTLHVPLCGCDCVGVSVRV